MLRPVCPTLLIGHSAETPALVQMLEEVGAPVVARGSERELLALLDERDVAVAAVDATGSLVPVEVVAATLSSLATSARPLLFVFLRRQLLASLGYPPGLDDFVLWPCSPQELETRLALARWRRLGLTGEGILRSGELSVDVRRHRVLVGMREAILTLREYELLRALVEARGEVLSREDLLAAVWGEDYLGGARTVDIHIRRLRAKLPEISHRLVTVRGVGYRLALSEEA
ncbi:MAG: response regulator transcription factor [Armatimonadetes bacterium]|nr:response regulator transcription factor [Armatimonadota bacterium]